jgi:hypothetical protein
VYSLPLETVLDTVRLQGAVCLWFSQFLLEMLDDVYRRTQVILFTVKCSVAEHCVRVLGGELEFVEMCLWLGG